MLTALQTMSFWLRSAYGGASALLTDLIWDLVKEVEAPTLAVLQLLLHSFVYTSKETFMQKLLESPASPALMPVRAS